MRNTSLVVNLLYFPQFFSEITWNANFLILTNSIIDRKQKIKILFFQKF